MENKEVRDRIDKFHSHLDACSQCRNHPFGLCAVGATLLKEAAMIKVKGATMNGRDFTVKLNSFEVGVLLGVIMQLPDIKRQALKPVYEQLLAFDKQFEEEAGVTKEVIPGGGLKITDKDGNVTTRDPYPWEVAGN